MKPSCKAETHGKFDFDELPTIGHKRFYRKSVKRSMIKARRRFNKSLEMI